MKEIGQGIKNNHNFIVLLGSLLIALIGIVFFVVAMIRMNKTEEKSTENMENKAYFSLQNASEMGGEVSYSVGEKKVYQVDDAMEERPRVNYYLRQLSEKEGYIKEWELSDGMIIPARTWGQFTVVAVPQLSNEEVSNLQIVASDKELVTISENQITVNEIKKYEKVMVTVFTGTEETSLSFCLDVQHGGWNTLNGEYYFVSGSGNIKTNQWRDDGEFKRYLNEGGLAVKGWYTIDGKMYFFDDKARMVTGEVLIDGKTYIFDEDGVLKQ